MPISGPSSYIPTMQQFEAHWALVNTDLAPKPLKLPDGTVLADFTELKGMIATAETAISTAQTHLDEVRDDLLVAKKALKAELELFRQAVLGEVPGTRFAASLPTIPRISSNQSRFLRPFQDAAAIWSRINTTPPTGFTPPLVLADDLQLLEFNAMLANLQTAYNTVTNAENALLDARKQRDSNFPLARTWMVQYRISALGRLDPNDPLRNSIPRYSRIAGATPKAVTNLAFTYNATTNRVKLTFFPSPSKNITQYEVRYSSGAKYNPVGEQTIATLPATGPYEFDFVLDMIQPGATGLFKVYVLNATGNHRASKVFAIMRAAAIGLTLTDTTATGWSKAA